MHNYPRLPTIDPRKDNEPIAYYGARLVVFLLNTGVTATLSDDDLELADYAIGRALSGDVAIGPQDNREHTPVAVYDRLEDIRRTLTLIRKARKADAPVASPVQPDTAVPKDGGSKVLTPVRPILRPPSGTHATVDIAF